MDLYTTNFFVASALAAILAVFLTRRKRFRLLALPIVPVLHYVLFYNYDSGLVGGIFPLLVPYAGALYAAVFFAFLASYKADSEQHASERKSSAFRAILSCIVLFLLILYSQIIPWAIDTFPLSNVEAILFTVFAGANEGSEEFVISSFMANAIRPALHLFACAAVLIAAVSLLVSKRRIKADFRFWKLRLTLASKGFSQVFQSLGKFALIAMAAYCFVISLVLPGIVTSAPFHALFQQPIDSELYREYYANPDSVQILAPEQPRNLIVIFLESMETNFARYTPEINELGSQCTNFAPGGVNVAGTSWTIAAITGKLCGIPLNMPMNIEEYVGKLPTYLPNARCLMEVLDKYGYKQVFLQGSSGDFTQKRTFWNVHGNVDVHDIEFFKKNGDLPDDYKVFWGFEDRRLYGFARRELDSLSRSGAPFALYMLTVDTHQPGFVDDSCAVEFADVGGKLPQALRCASRQLADFIGWAKRQPWFENTVVSVMGDHTMPNLSAKANIPADDTLYWINLMMNSVLEPPVHSKRYSSLDMFPTLLESMGFVLDGRALGLGRSLYADVPTLLETFGAQKLDSLLRERSIQYDYFLMGK